MLTWYWSWFVWPPHACAHGTNHGSFDHLTLMHMVLIMFIWPPHTYAHGTDHGSVDHFMLVHGTNGSFDRLMLVHMVLIMFIWPPRAYAHSTDHGSFDHLTLTWFILPHTCTHLTTSCLHTWYWSWFIWPPDACIHAQCLLDISGCSAMKMVHQAPDS